MTDNFEEQIIKSVVEAEKEYYRECVKSALRELETIKKQRELRAVNLRKIRTERGYSQGKLAELSEVNVRMIQHYEQGVKDINLAQAITVFKLAQALECNMEELLELKFNLVDDLSKPINTELNDKMKKIYDENKHLFLGTDDNIN